MEKRKPQPYLIKVIPKKDAEPKFFDTLHGKWLNERDDEELLPFHEALKVAKAHQIASFFRNDQLQLILLPTEECNFRCVYCYQNFEVGRMRPQVVDGIKHLVERRIGSLRVLEIGWFGGEPLFAYDIVLDLSRFFKQHAERSGVSLTQHMTTNGYYLTPDVFEELNALGLNHFQITLDGEAHTHDQKRMRADGEGTFATIWENLLHMKGSNRDFTVVLRINIDLENAPHVPAFIRTLAEHFGHDGRFVLHLHKVGRWGGPNDDKLRVLGDNGGELLTELYRQAKSLGLRLDLDLRPGSHVCYAALPYSFVIRADGRVNKCTVALEEPENQVGRISPDGSLLIHNDLFKAWVFDNALNDGVCGTCALRPLCEGAACPWIRIKENRRPCPPIKQNPQAYLELLREGVSR